MSKRSYDRMTARVNEERARKKRTKPSDIAPKRITDRIQGPDSQGAYRFNYKPKHARILEGVTGMIRGLKIGGHEHHEHHRSGSDASGRQGRTED